MGYDGRGDIMRNVGLMIIGCLQFGSAPPALSHDPAGQFTDDHGLNHLLVNLIFL